MSDEVDIPLLLIDDDYREHCRNRMQTDLFWLAKYVLGYTLLSEQYHREAVEVFVHKDNRKPIREQSAQTRRMLILPRKTYKALALDTKVPTPQGFKTMGEIGVGDVVFAETGKPAKVIGVSPIYLSNICYKIEFITGETVVADEGHLWLTDTRRDRDNIKNRKEYQGHHGKAIPCPSVKTTQQIFETVMCRDERNHRLKISKALTLPNAELPVPPYVLGYWLGNGNKDGGAISCADPEVIVEIQREGQAIRYANLAENNPYKWVLNGGPEHPDYWSKTASFRSRIRNLDLFENKHIPMLYLRGSYDQRLALLQGLMDSDGNASKRDGRAIFCNTNLRLIQDVKELVASLGFKVRIHGPYDAKLDGEIVGSFYHVDFNPYSDTKIFRLERKQNLLRDRRAISKQDYRSISSVEKVDSVPVRCIMVDSPSQLFLITEGFIPTHNTSISIADSVQWIINFPDVAIMVMTAANSGENPLADSFVGEVASHFYCAPNGSRKPLHICFPEHRISRMPPAGTFITPARTKFRRDPTIRGVSIEQSLSGGHPDILKGEDVQDNRNSQTVTGLRKVRKNFYLNLKMLGEGGYVDLTCTRYGPADLYGDMIQKAGPETIILWKPAYVRKLHAIDLDEDELMETDVTLQFPEQLSWEFLMSEKALDPETFYTQYLNIAEGNFVPTFPIDRLNAAKISSEEDQPTGTVHIAWRFEYAECKYAACAVGIERDNRVIIVEVQRGQYTPMQLAKRVVACAKRWETRRVMIEDTPGARSMIISIQNAALEASWRIEIVWIEFQNDATARSLAIKAAEPQLLAGRLLFEKGIKNLDEAYRQLYHFGMIEDTEVATVVTRVAAQLPQSIAAQNFNANDEEVFQAFVQRDAYDRVYNRGAYYHDAQQPVEIEEEWTPPNDDNEYMPGLSG